MINENIIISNKFGLHTRAAAKLVNIASSFESQIQLKNLSTGREANCKSIMALLLMGAAYGSTLQLNIYGADEHEAYRAIVELIQNHFGEPE